MALSLYPLAKSNLGKVSFKKKIHLKITKANYTHACTQKCPLHKKLHINMSLLLTHQSFSVSAKIFSVTRPVGRCIKCSWEPGYEKTRPKSTFPFIHSVVLIKKIKMLVYCSINRLYPQFSNTQSLHSLWDKSLTLFLLKCHTASFIPREKGILPCPSQGPAVKPSHRNYPR